MSEDIDVNKDIEAAKPETELMENAVDRSATKADAAFAMSLYGASYTEIAKQLGYSSAFRARAAVERVLAASADSEDDRDKMRVLISRRLNRLLASHMPKAVNPEDPNQLAYSARALAIIDRQARLYGVDAPTQIAVSVSDDHIRDYLEALVPAAKDDLLQIEADIMDADVIEGGD